MNCFVDHHRSTQQKADCICSRSPHRRAFTVKPDQARQRAERSFKQEERAQDARKAMTEYECQAFATREKTTRLKELRLAKEAQARLVIAL